LSVPTSEKDLMPYVGEVKKLNKRSYLEDLDKHQKQQVFMIMKNKQWQNIPKIIFLT
jgi:hypothetical protein